ncbi:hypothetical protein FBALC1_11117 [Flavobacteriales bacterium ALC-1]|nr:hypothetical protein FBALC1_11117 [Flavobacteriales bacterium ALC-1]
MKKIISITALVLFTMSTLIAQDSTDVKNKGFNFGVRIGYSAYSFNTNNRAPYGSGYYGGLFFEKRLSEKWALQFETNFNYTGSSTLQFPILLKYKISGKFEIFGGPQLDYSFEQTTMSIESRNKRFGASLVIGAQYNINSKWFVEARYIYGLTDQFPVYEGANPTSAFTKKNSFNFGVGYKF